MMCSRFSLQSMGMRTLCRTALAAALVAASSPSPAADAPKPSPAPRAAAVPDGKSATLAPADLSPSDVFRIGPEDMLQISVWQNADLTRTTPVRPDGMISLPLLNDVRAAGLTPLELRDEIRK